MPGDGCRVKFGVRGSGFGVRGSETACPPDDGEYRVKCHECHKPKNATNEEGAACGIFKSAVAPWELFRRARRVMLICGCFLRTGWNGFAQFVDQHPRIF